MRTELALYREQLALNRMLDEDHEHNRGLTMTDLEFVAGAAYALAWVRQEPDSRRPSDMRRLRPL